jgi:hypothetical protein
MLMRKLLAGVFSLVLGLALVSGCTPPPGQTPEGSAPKAGAPTTEKAPAPAAEAPAADENKAAAPAEEKK